MITGKQLERAYERGHQAGREKSPSYAENQQLRDQIEALQHALSTFTTGDQPLMSQRYMTKVEHNAILAGLRLLQHSRANPAIREILTDGLPEGHKDITESEIDDLCEAINLGEVQLRVQT